MNDHDFWTERLSDWIDGGLPDREAASVARHVGECGECSRTADDLRELRARAAALKPIDPEQDLWDAIASRLGEDPLAGEVIDLTERLDAQGVGRPTTTVALDAGTSARRSRGFRVSGLQAAAVAGVMLVGGWALGNATAGSPPGAVSGTVSEQLVTSGGVVRQASDLVGEETLQGRVDELERAVVARRGELAPETLEVLERNLGLIDRALAESMAALRADPENEYLRQHISRSLHRREAALATTVRLLERASD